MLAGAMRDTRLLPAFADAWLHKAAAVDGLVGVTAIELDADGLITRVTSVYDGRQVPVERRTAIVDATFAS